MSPWKIVGWENVVSDKTGKMGIRVYLSREIQSEAGFGQETYKIYFNPEYVKYEPAIGDIIIYTEGRFGIDKIYKIS